MQYIDPHLYDWMRVPEVQFTHALLQRNAYENAKNFRVSMGLKLCLRLEGEGL
jgi:hypothetical protein